MLLLLEQRVDAMHEHDGWLNRSVENFVALILVNMRHSFLKCKLARLSQSDESRDQLGYM